MSLQIREAIVRDVPTMCELMSQLTHRQVEVQEMLGRLEFVQQSRVDFLYVCTEPNSEHVLGIMGFRIRENMEEESRYGEISVLVVDQQIKRRGVGRELMNFAEDLARRHQCKGTWLVSGLGRKEEAHQFYKELGYEVTGYRFVKRMEN